MALIRHAEASKIARDAVVLDLGDIAAQGRRLVEDAERRAAAILEGAEAERVRLISDAHEVGERAGRAAGHAEGLELGTREGTERAYAEHAPAIGALLSSWEGALAEFASKRDRLYDEAIADVVRLAIVIGEKVARRTIETDPGVVVRQVSEALAMVSAGTRVSLRVHPADRALVEELFPSMVADSVSREIVIRPDETLSRGSCVADYTKERGRSGEDGSMSERVESLAHLSPAARSALASVQRASVRSELSTVDATIETQIERIVEALLPGEPVATEDASEPTGSDTPIEAADDVLPEDPEATA